MTGNQPQQAELQPVIAREQLVQLMRATIADQAAHNTWTYHAVRPLPVPPTWAPGQHVVGDCSKGVQYLCRWAGAPDPMLSGWSMWGNSQTIAANLAHLEQPSMLAAGDIVTFGPGGSAHAAMVLEPGGDPLVWSFGHQGAPNTYRLSQDRRQQQYLRLPVPKPTPPLDAQLRGRTGYWAWLAWSLGEGDWKPYGRFAKTVRPNVKKLIPPTWWAARVRFLAARKRGNKPDG